jgi:hypothetical protein
MLDRVMVRLSFSPQAVIAEPHGDLRGEAADHLLSALRPLTTATLRNVTLDIRRVDAFDYEVILVVSRLVTVLRTSQMCVTVIDHDGKWTYSPLDPDCPLL